MLTKEQIEQRKHSIGGSDASVVMGLNPWKSSLQLWLEKTGAVEAEDLSENESVYFGNVLEAVVADEFQKRHPEFLVVNDDLEITHKYCDYITGTIDRWVERADGTRVGLEIKTASAYKTDEWNGDNIPTHYLAQVQHYMAITGCEEWWVACLIGGQKYVERLVLRDDAFISLMLDAERSFWDRVCNVIPPDVDGSESAADALKAVYPQSVADKAIELDEKIGNAIDLKIIYEKSLDEYEAQVRALSNKIKEAMQDAEWGKVGKWLVSYKTSKAGHRILRIKEVAECRE